MADKGPDGRLVPSSRLENKYWLEHRPTSRSLTDQRARPKKQSSLLKTVDEMRRMTPDRRPDHGAAQKCVLRSSPMEGIQARSPKYLLGSDNFPYVAWITFRGSLPASLGLTLPTWPAKFLTAAFATPDWQRPCLFVTAASATEIVDATATAQSVSVIRFIPPAYGTDRRGTSVIRTSLSFQRCTMGLRPLRTFALHRAPSPPRRCRRRRVRAGSPASRSRSLRLP